MADDDLYPNWVAKNSVSPRVQRLETGAQRLQANTLRPTIGIYKRIPANALVNGTDIDLTHSSLTKKGGVSVSGNISGFAYTSTDHSITWYWDGTNGSHVIVINRADGTRFTVPTSGSGLTVSGLTLSTTYYFLPFWNVQNVCNIGWVQGTVGSPQIAFVAADTTDAVNTQSYAMAQTLQGNEPLTAGFMTAQTAAGGGSGGGGGGGGGGAGKCVMAGTDIKTLGDLSYSINVRGNFEWIHLKTALRELFCTADHPLYHASAGKITADKLAAGDIVITELGEERLTFVGR